MRKTTAPAQAELTEGATASPLGEPEGVEPEGVPDFEIEYGADGIPRYKKVVRPAYELRDPIEDERANPNVDPFDFGPEYTQNPKYADMEFYWGSERSISDHDITATHGWVPITEAIGHRVRKLPSGLVARGTMIAMQRPKALRPYYEKREEERRRMFSGTAEDAELEGRMEELRRSGGRGMTVRDARIDLDMGDTPEVLAGGSSRETDYAARLEEVNKARERGRTSFGGFNKTDGAVPGTVPESPFFRNRK